MNSWYRRSIMFQWNCNGLRGKMGDFHTFVAQYISPVLRISEARTERNFRLANYVVYTSDRGVAPSRAMLCVRQDIPSVLVASSSTQAPEFVRCKVVLGNTTVTIVSVYIEPHTAIAWSDLSDMCRPDGSLIICCEDFNAPHELWNSTTTDNRGRQIARLLDLFDYAVLNDGSSTFLRGRSNSNVLDISFCSSDLASGADWTIDVDTRGSDHYPIYIHHLALGSSPPRHS